MAGKPRPPGRSKRQLVKLIRGLNEKLIISSVRQHERADAAEKLNTELADEMAQRRRSEEALREMQVELTGRAGRLEQTVGERTAELSSSNEQLQALVYSIAHHLRAPLRAVQGYASLLLQVEGETLSPVGKSYAERIQRSAQFLDAMLIDLLAFQSISQARLELVPVKLEAAVAEALASLEREREHTGARVELLGPWPSVLAHHIVLGKVLFNLLHNALKFVAPGTAPHVRLWTEPSPTDAERVRLWVEDNGIGIAAEHQAELFQLFNRLHGEQYPGTGIGLTLVEKAMQRMGGEVGVESAPGQGSRFWIELGRAP